MRAATKGSEMPWRRAVMPIRSGALDSSGPGGGATPTAASAPDMILLGKKKMEIRVITLEAGRQQSQPARGVRQAGRDGTRMGGFVFF